MDSLSIKRRLSCILAADAVGFSKQMGSDEEGTVRVLSAHRAVIDGIITFHEGRIVSTAGDSVLAEFSSVVEAVRCAVEIQEALKTRNDSLSADHRMLFRVGINLGDVVVKDKNVLGDGVNVAARLESIAEPGGICISSSVYDQITGKLDLGFEDMGEQTLKNISRPIRAYRMSGATAMARMAKRTPARSLRKSAVLAIGALCLGAISAAIGWQAGLFRNGPSGGTSATVVAPAVPTPSETAAKSIGTVAVPAAGDPGAAGGSAKGPTASATTGNATTSAPNVTPGGATGNATRGGVATAVPPAGGAAGTQRSFVVTQPQRPYRGADALNYQTELELARARANAAAGRGGTTITRGDSYGAGQRPQAEVIDGRARQGGDAVSGWRRGQGSSTPPMSK